MRENRVVEDAGESEADVVHDMVQVIAGLKVQGVGGSVRVYDDLSGTDMPHCHKNTSFLLYLSLKNR